MVHLDAGKLGLYLWYAVTILWCRPFYSQIHISHHITRVLSSVTLVNIGASQQAGATRAALPEAQRQLYTGFNEGEVCAFRNNTGPVRTFGTYPYDPPLE